MAIRHISHSVKEVMINLGIDTKEDGFTEIPSYVYPMRPLSGIPIYMRDDEVYPEFWGAAAHDDVVIQTKLNGERALYDAEKDELWNRHGSEFKGGARLVELAWESCQRIRDDYGYRWFDLELMGGKTKRWKYTAMLIDLPNLSRLPLSERLLRMLELVIPQLDVMAPRHCLPVNHDGLFLPDSVLGGAHNQPKLGARLNAMQHENARAEDIEYEGVVIKRLSSKYMIQNISSSADSPDWVKHRFSRNI